MTTVLTFAAGIIAVVAALRSTWSPCGLSMLATITPLAERGRGHHYRATASWFVTGSVVGGASLGLVMGGLAAGVRTLGASSELLAVVAAVAALVTAASDASLGGFRLPLHHRQVNERWLDQFRSWVYGAGFGWQIGSGLTTYIKTCAVYLMIVLAALTGSPATAFVVGTVFGLVRGLAVYLGRNITTTTALADFHRRFVATDPIALAVVVVCEAAVALSFSAIASPWLGVLFAVIGGAALAWSMRRRGTAPTHLGDEAKAAGPVTIR
jgi:hypothetical protein